jgi:hypothetical protein
VLLASFDIEPATTPNITNGTNAPMQKTKNVREKYSGSKMFNIGTKIGAMHGSRK